MEFLQLRLSLAGRTREQHPWRVNSQARLLGAATQGAVLVAAP